MGQAQTAKQIKLAIEAAGRNQIDREETEFFGNRVWVQPWSSVEMESWRLFARNKDESIRIMAVAKAVQLSLVDENGNHLYQSNEVTQIAGLRPAVELDKIEEIVMRLNGYNIEGMEEILKNLQKTRGVSSAPDSPESTSAAKKNSSKDTQPEISPSNT